MKTPSLENSNPALYTTELMDYRSKLENYSTVLSNTSTYSPRVPPCLLLRYFHSGSALSPFTSIFANISNFTPKLSSTYFLISSFGQGSYKSQNMCHFTADREQTISNTIFTCSTPVVKMEFYMFITCGNTTTTFI